MEREGKRIETTSLRARTERAFILKQQLCSYEFDDSLGIMLKFFSTPLIYTVRKVLEQFHFKV